MNQFDKAYHTLNSAIPLTAKDNPHEAKIGMDTAQNRNGLHLWIGENELVEDERPLKKGQKKRRKKIVFVSKSVHLSRDDAWNLIEEIKERLF